MNIKHLIARNVFKYDTIDLSFDNETYLVMACKKDERINEQGKLEIFDNFEKSNGVGKSAIIELVLYALFGETLRDLDDISKHHTGKFYLELEFDDKRIIRTEKGITLYIGTEKYERKKMQGQSLIDDLIKLDFNMLNYTNIFSPENNFFKLKDDEKKNVLMKLINVDFIDIIYDKIEKHAKVLRESKLDNIIEIYTKELVNVDEIKQKEEKARLELEKIQVLEEGLRKYNEFKTKLSNKVPGYIELMKSIRTRRIELRANKEKLAHLPMGDDTEEFQNKLYVLIDAISGLKTKVNDFKSKKNKLQTTNVCPVLEGVDCDKLTVEYKNNTISKWDLQIADIQAKINKAMTDTNKVEQDIKAARNNKRAYDEFKATFDGEHKVYLSDKERSIVLKDEIRKLTAENKELRHLKDCKVSLQDIRLRQMDHANYLAQYKMLVDKQEKLNEIKQKNDKIHSELDTLDVLKKIFGKDGLKQFIVSRIIQFLEQKINEMISNIFDDIMIKFYTTFEAEKRNSLKIKVIRAGNEVTLNEFSAGEKRIFEVIFQIALRDLFLNFSKQDFNIIFLDEIFDVLDKNNVRLIADVLGLLKNETNTMFVVSHNPDIQNLFEKSIIITSSKDDKNSWIGEKNG